MPALILASHNPWKLREMRALLQGTDIRLITPMDRGLEIKVEEKGQSYAENAARKTLAFARSYELLALGDDSGLEVEALGGAPGIFSARFSPKFNATDADRRAYLLELLKEYNPPWRAAFHCTLALATPNGEITYTHGQCQGEIIPQERGENGFGYDPIFLIPELGRTMAELSLQEKNHISHRAKAVTEAIPLILTYLSKL